MVLEAIATMAKNSQSVVAIMLTFLQNVRMIFMNVIYRLPSIRKSLRPSLKNYNLMLLFCKT